MMTLVTVALSVMVVLVSLGTTTTAIGRDGIAASPLLPPPQHPSSPQHHPVADPLTLEARRAIRRAGELARTVAAGGGTAGAHLLPPHVGSAHDIVERLATGTAVSAAHDAAKYASESIRINKGITVRPSMSTDPNHIEVHHARFGDTSTNSGDGTGTRSSPSQQQEVPVAVHEIKDGLEALVQHVVGAMHGDGGGGGGGEDDVSTLAQLEKELAQFERDEANDAVHEDIAGDSDGDGSHDAGSSVHSSQHAALEQHLRGLETQLRQLEVRVKTASSTGNVQGALSESLQTRLRAELQRHDQRQERLWQLLSHRQEESLEEMRITAALQAKEIRDLRAFLSDKLAAAAAAHHAHHHDDDDDEHAHESALAAHDVEPPALDAEVPAPPPLQTPVPAPEEQSPPPPPPPSPPPSPSLDATIVLPLNLSSDWSAWGREYDSPKVTVFDDVCTLSGLLREKIDNKGHPPNAILRLPRQCWPPGRLAFTTLYTEATNRVDIMRDGFLFRMPEKKETDGWLTLNGVSFSVRPSLDARALEADETGAAVGGVPPAPAQPEPSFIETGLLRHRHRHRRRPHDVTPVVHGGATTDNAPSIRFAKQPAAGGQGGSNTTVAATAAAAAAAAAAAGGLKLLHGWAPIPDDNDVQEYARPQLSVHQKFCFLDGVIQGGEFYETGSKKKREFVAFAVVADFCRPENRLVFSVNHQNEVLRVDLLPDGKLMFAGGKPQFSYVSLSGMVWSPKASTKLEFNAVSGWDNYGQMFHQAFVTRNGPYCALQGLVINKKKWVVDQTIIHLPDECIPKKKLVFGANSHDIDVRVDITTNGDIVYHHGKGHYNWLSLTGLFYSVAEEGDGGGGVNASSSPAAAAAAVPHEQHDDHARQNKEAAAAAAAAAAPKDDELHHVSNSGFDAKPLTAPGQTPPSGRPQANRSLPPKDSWPPPSSPPPSSSSASSGEKQPEEAMRDELKANGPKLAPRRLGGRFLLR